MPLTACEETQGESHIVLEEIEDTEEQSLVEVRKLKETYKEVFDDEGELKPMIGDPYKIEMRNDKYSRYILRTGNSMGSVGDEQDFL